VPYSVVHWEISLRNSESADFYRSLFGWQLDMDNDWNYGMVEAEGEGSIGGGVTVSPDRPGYLTFYVVDANPPETLKRVADLGGKVIMEPMPVPGVGQIAMFTDPEGNMIGLFKPERQ